MSDVLNSIADARKAVLEHRYADAAELATAILAQLPMCLAAMRVLAWAQLELEQDAALDSFERCGELDPEDALAHVGQAIWYQQRNESEAAAAQWQRAWELDPDNQSIRRALVKLSGELPESELADAIGLLRTGRFEMAVDGLRSLHRQTGDIAVSLALMTALCESGARREALELAASVYNRGFPSVKAALYVAAVEDQAGRTLRGREAIARAEQVDPGLMLFADVVRQVGLQPAVDMHRAARSPLAAAR
jgi:tetratricopeptide (TPR) repeat protein